MAAYRVDDIRHAYSGKACLTFRAHLKIGRIMHTNSSNISSQLP